MQGNRDRIVTSHIASSREATMNSVVNSSIGQQLLRLHTCFIESAGGVAEAKGEESAAQPEGYPAYFIKSSM